MNDKFESDHAVEALQKAAKSVRAPKLDESILENATKVAAKPSLVERLGLNRKLASFSLAGAAASVAVAAVVLGGVLNPQPTFTLEMGASAPQGSRNTATGEAADSKVGGLSYYPSPIEINYVAGDALGTNAGTGSIYEFVNNTTAKELSAAIKRVLKIDGGFVTETYGIETPTGTEKVTYFNLQSGAINVYVSDTNGALSFNYSNASAWVMGECVKEETSAEMPTFQATSRLSHVRSNSSAVWVLKLTLQTSRSTEPKIASTPSPQSRLMANQLASHGTSPGVTPAKSAALMATLSMQSRLLMFQPSLPKTP